MKIVHNQLKALIKLKKDNTGIDTIQVSDRQGKLPLGLVCWTSAACGHLSSSHRHLVLFEQNLCATGEELACIRCVSLSGLGRAAGLSPRATTSDA